MFAGLGGGDGVCFVSAVVAFGGDGGDVGCPCGLGAAFGAGDGLSWCGGFLELFGLLAGWLVSADGACGGDDGGVDGVVVHGGSPCVWVWCLYDTLVGARGCGWVGLVVAGCGFECFLCVFRPVVECVLEELCGLCGGGLLEEDCVEGGVVHAVEGVDDGAGGGGLSRVFGGEHGWWLVWVFVGWGVCVVGCSGDGCVDGGWCGVAGVGDGGAGWCGGLGWGGFVVCVVDGAVEDVAGVWRGGGSEVGFADVAGHALEESPVVGLGLHHQDQVVEAGCCGVGVLEEVFVPVDGVEDVFPADDGGVPCAHEGDDAGVVDVLADGWCPVAVEEYGGGELSGLAGGGA